MIVQLLCFLCAASKAALSSTQAGPTTASHNAHVEVVADGDDSVHVLPEKTADMAQPHYEPDMHMMMGAALVGGFVLMLLIDQLWKHSHSHPQHGTGGELCMLTSLCWTVSGAHWVR